MSNFNNNVIDDVKVYEIVRKYFYALNTDYYSDLEYIKSVSGFDSFKDLILAIDENHLLPACCIELKDDFENMNQVDVIKLIINECKGCL